MAGNFHYIEGYSENYRIFAAKSRVFARSEHGKPNFRSSLEYRSCLFGPDNIVAYDRRSICIQVYQRFMGRPVCFFETVKTSHISQQHQLFGHASCKPCSRCIAYTIIFPALSHLLCEGASFASIFAETFAKLQAEIIIFWKYY